MGIFGAVALIATLSDSRLIGSRKYAEFNESDTVIGLLSIPSGPLNVAERLQLARQLGDLTLSTERAPEMISLFLDELAIHPRLNSMHRVLYSHIYGNVFHTMNVNYSPLT